MRHSEKSREAGSGVQRLRCVTWRGYDTPLRTGDYLETHGLSLDSIYVTDDDSTLEAVGRGGVDIGAGPEVEFIAPMVEQGLAEPIEIDRLSNYDSVLPFFADNPLLSHMGKQYGVRFTWGITPLLYRPDRVNEPPTSWFDVLKPEFKGKVVMAVGPWGNVRMWGKLVTGATAGEITQAQLGETIDFLIRLKKEQALDYASSFDELAVLLAGEGAIATFGWEPVALWAREMGAEVTSRPSGRPATSVTSR